MVGQGIDAQLASRLQDWIDENTDALPAGAEDDFYLLLDQPYRTSNTRLSSVSELQLMQILEPGDFEKLLPLVTVLPETAAINMNTVSAPVLTALGENMTMTDAKGFH